MLRYGKDTGHGQYTTSWWHGSMQPGSPIVPIMLYTTDTPTCPTPKAGTVCLPRKGIPCELTPPTHPKRKFKSLGPHGARLSCRCSGGVGFRRDPSTGWTWTGGFQTPSPRGSRHLWRSCVRAVLAVS
eukprot:scaffold35290_cov57-Phaeocystis_antarctica.AAC.3